MKVLGIDPGTRQSGVVIYDTDGDKVIHSRDEFENEDLLCALRENDRFEIGECELAIEDIEGMGQMVGRDVFETCVWIGRFIEAWEYNHGGLEAYRISRGDVKIVLCGCKTIKNPKTGKRQKVSDSLIRHAVIQKFPSLGGGKTPQIGIAKAKGPLYGVKGHCWQALAVILTFLETR